MDDYMILTLIIITIVIFTIILSILSKDLKSCVLPDSYDSTRPNVATESRTDAELSGVYNRQTSENITYVNSVPSQQQIPTVYSQELQNEINDTLPEYHEIESENLPSYHEVMNSNVVK
ncbi:hypothetical protein PVAND_017417 [Polypedilum vanderplanki]|uniref:Uncharacterized protein n=1 Tax=Polypedilum vanderplanki TaxID=319348 RepID=A0A9J6BII5_POLVA|nr:hypothetical protein PVAND_017417 [Polypedilum vanderplanki]